MTRHLNPYNIRWMYCSSVFAREGSTAAAADQQNYTVGASITTGGGAQANFA
jgi:hypothetical protein